MKNEYTILSKNIFDQFPFQQTELKITEPDLLLEMTFSPKLFILNDISPKIEALIVNGVEWLDARVDYSPSQPSEDNMKIFVCLTFTKLIV